MSSSAYPIPVSALPIDSRVTFLNRTYQHLFGAVVGFVLLEMLFFSSGIAYPMARAMLGTSWLLVLGGFMLLSWFATHVAHTAVSRGAQYGALVAYVTGWSILFVPLLAIAQIRAPGSIQSAALVTILAFGALTALVFVSKQDFSFLGSLLKWGGILALCLIVAGVLFGFELGTFFSVAMVGFAGAAILYDTSNILLRYPADRYVGAALQLFASVALLFWYILRIFSGSRR